MNLPNIKKILLAAVFALGTAAAFAQPKEPAISEKARQWYDQAGSLITARKFDQAAAVLLKAVEIV